MPSMLEALERKYFAPLEELLPDVDNDVNICFVSVGNDTQPTTHDIINTTTTATLNNDTNNNNNNNSSNNNNINNNNNNNTNHHQHHSSVNNNGNNDEHLISIFIPRLPPLKSVPELLVLNDCDIDCAGDFDSIKDKCRRVRELDLAQNKLRDWTEVSEIIKHMPRIEFLNLSKNQLMSPISHADIFTPNINNLRGIVLNGTYLDWQGVEVLLQNLPRLEELHLSLNNYTEVLIDAHSESCNCFTSTAEGDSSTSSCSDDSHDEQLNCRRYRKTRAHEALKILHFTGNPIEHWEDICRLGRVFPHLENLVLADCPIKTINTTSEEHEACKSEATEMSGTNEAFKYFPNLVLLNLSCANINTWDDIDRLAQFPKLNNLRVKNWPLWERLECTEHERRQLLIARLPNVRLLNGGGIISNDEREDAERAFIRYYMDKPACERPKRYEELIGRHGKLDPLVNVNLKPDKRIKVLITYGDKTEERMLDVYRTVSDLKQKLEKIYNLPANKMRLFYVDQDYKEFGPEIMKYPNKFLYSYNIQPGDEIIIDEKK